MAKTRKTSSMSIRLDEITTDALFFLRDLPGGYNLNKAAKRNILDTAIVRGWMPGATIEKKALSPRLVVAASPSVDSIHMTNTAEASLPISAPVVAPIDVILPKEIVDDAVFNAYKSEVTSVGNNSDSATRSVNVSITKPAAIDTIYSEDNQTEIPDIKRMIFDITRVVEFNKRANKMSSIDGGIPALI